MAAALIERQAEKLGQVLDHRARQLAVARDLRGNRVQRIEQEMRVELHAERVQARLAEIPLQAFHAQLGREYAPARKPGLGDASDEAVHQQAPDETASQRVLDKMRVPNRSPCADADRRRHECCDVHVDCGEHERQYAMGDKPLPVLAA